MNVVMEYADQREMFISLETHNPKNVSMYQHFGFELYETIDHYPDLVQYCMVRKAAGYRAPIPIKRKAPITINMVIIIIFENRQTEIIIIKYLCLLMPAGV